MVRTVTKTDKNAVIRVQGLIDKIENAREERMKEIQAAAKSYHEDLKKEYFEHFVEELKKFGPEQSLIEALMKGATNSDVTIKPNNKEIRWPVLGEILFSLNGTPVRTQ